MKINFRKIFDWSIENVGPVTPVYVEYVDAGKVQLGYEVTVYYKHHGQDVLFFGIDSDKFSLMPEGLALKRATSKYKRMQAKVTCK